MDQEFGKKSRLWLSFCIGNFNCSPDEISALLKLRPNRVQKRGQLIQNMRVKARFNLWSLKIESKNHDSTTQVRQLLKKLKNFQKMKSKIKKFDAWITIVLEVVGNDTSPSVGISKDQIKQLGKMGIPVSVDYYFFRKSLQRRD